MLKRTLIQAVRFAVVGVANTAVGLAAIYSLMYFFSMGPLASNAIGYGLGLCVSFILNKQWTFSQKHLGMKSSAVKYMGLAALSYLLNFVAVWTATRSADVDGYVAQMFGVVVYSGAMFLGCKVYVFRPERGCET